MVLKKKLIPVPIGQIEMDSRVDPKTHSGIIRTVNGIHQRKGLIQKRTGSEKLADLHQDSQITTYNDNIVIYGKSAKAIDSTDAVIPYNFSGGLLDVQVKGIAHSRRDCWFYVDIAEAGSVIGIVYTVKDPDSVLEYSVFCETFNKDTGARLDTQLIEGPTNSVHFAKIIRAKDLIMSYYYINNLGILQQGGINTTTGIITAPVNVAGAPAALLSRYWLDICLLESSVLGTPYVAFLYPASAGGGSTSVYGSCANGGPTATYSTTITYSGAAVGWGIFKMGNETTQIDNSAGYVIADYVSGTGITTLYAAQAYYYLVHRTANGAIDTYTEIDEAALNISGIKTGPDLATVYWTLDALVNNIPFIRKNTIDGSGASMTSGTASTVKNRARMATKPFREATTTKHHLGVYSKSWGFPTGVQDTIFWLDEDGYSVGKTLPGKSKTDDDYGILCNTQEIGTDGYTNIAAVTYLIRDDNGYDNKDIYQIARMEINSSASINVSAVENSDYLVIANSIPYEIDGNSMVEQGFLNYPEPFALTSGVTGSMLVGSYEYRVLYEWTDGLGHLHESSPSPETGSITLAGGENNVLLTIPSLTFTRKENVHAAIYRTVEGPGTTFYRVGSIKNDRSQPTIQFKDDFPDSNITINQSLYIIGGEVENIPPPSSKVISMWNKRQFTVDRENDSTHIFYSKEFNPGGAIKNSDLFLLECDFAGGSITAMHPLIDKLIIFKNDRIYATEGVGLDSRAAGNNFLTPYLISPSIGCSNQKTIVSVPNGLLFEGTDGNIWQLGLNLQVSPVGLPVDFYTDTLTIVGAGVDNPNHHAVFLTDGYALCYNWLDNKWSIFTNHEAVAATNLNDKIYWIDTSGYVRRDDSTYTDDIYYIPLRVDTGWFSFAGIAGFKRVYKLIVLGQNIGTHTLRIRIAYDFDPTYTDSATYNADQLSTFGISDYFDDGLSSNYDDQSYMIEIPTSRQKCTSIRVSIEDEQTFSYNEGYSISSVSFLVGIREESSRIGIGRVA